MARQKKIKSPVKLREKSLSNGGKSLYLDIYHNGKREYLFLGIYLNPERTQADKIANANARTAAEKIRAEKEIDIYNGKAGISIKKGSTLSEWIESFYKKAEKNLVSVGSYKMLLYLVKAGKFGEIKMQDLTKRECVEIINFIRTYQSPRTGKEYAPQTQKNLQDIFSTILNAAVREDLIVTNPMHKVTSLEKIKESKTQRGFITLEDLKRLENTPAPDSGKAVEVCGAFLFACYCGLRISDIRGLKWENIITTNGKTFARIVMQKTKEPITIPLSEKAQIYLPPKQKGVESVFNGLPCRAHNMAVHLREWGKMAGVANPDKITFHTSRHTFATLAIQAGASIYEVQSLLGHSSPDITQIYAEMQSGQKMRAVEDLAKLTEKL